jgi:hypothetical protein
MDTHSLASSRGSGGEILNSVFINGNTFKFCSIVMHSLIITVLIQLVSNS